MFFFDFKDILQHFKFVNWRIRFLMSRTGYLSPLHVIHNLVQEFYKNLTIDLFGIDDIMETFASMFDVGHSYHHLQWHVHLVGGKGVIERKNNTFWERESKTFGKIETVNKAFLFWNWQRLKNSFFLEINLFCSSR